MSQQDERLIEEYKQQIEKLQNDITSLTKTKMKTDKKIEKLSTQLTLAEEKARLLEEQIDSQIDQRVAEYIEIAKQKIEAEKEKYQQAAKEMEETKQKMEKELGKLKHKQAEIEKNAETKAREKTQEIMQEVQNQYLDLFSFIGILDSMESIMPMVWGVFKSFNDFKDDDVMMKCVARINKTHQILGEFLEKYNLNNN